MGGKGAVVRGKGRGWKWGMVFCLREWVSEDWRQERVMCWEVKVKCLPCKVLKALGGEGHLPGLRSRGLAAPTWFRNIFRFGQYLGIKIGQSSRDRTHRRPSSCSYIFSVGYKENQCAGVK